MIRKRLLITVLIIFPVWLTAQNFRVGLGGGVNTVFFHKAASAYDKSVSVSTPQRFGYSLTAPVDIALKGKWHLRTGLGLQVKNYRFVQSDFNAPGIELSSYFGARFQSFEIPIVFNREVLVLGSPIAIELSAGCVLSLNSPTSSKIGYDFTSSDSALVYVGSPEPRWEKTFSPDIFLGLNMIHRGQQRITISYQYGLFKTARFDYVTGVGRDVSTVKEYNAILQPRLSALVISYVYYPKKWGYVKKN